MSAALWAEPRTGAVAGAGGSGVRECPGVVAGPREAGAVPPWGWRGPEAGSPEALEAPLGAAWALAAPGVQGDAASLQAPPPGLPVPPSRPDSPRPLPPVRPEAARLGLTGRESRVLDLASYGMTTPVIAKSLGLSPRTVTAILSSLFLRFGVRNRAALVGEGFRLGLLAPRPPRPGARVVDGPALSRLAPLLPLVAAGLMDWEIAGIVSAGCPITASAVRSRVKALRDSFGAVSREHLIRLVVEAGLLSVSADGARLVLADAVGGGV